MHTRYAAAASALLLTATAGLAASGGAAEASGAQQTTTRSATTLTVTIRSTQKGPKLSTTRIRPGKTLFKVVRGNEGGSMQLLRLKSGYTLAQAASDMGGLFSGDVSAVRRVDRHIVFYGGMDVPAKGANPNYWGTDIDKAGTYYVVNLNKNQLTALKAKGTHQRRALPGTGGWVNMATASDGSNVFKTPKTDPHKGWMKTTNNAAEPHFVVLNQVQETTTRTDVQNYFNSGDSNPPSFALPGQDETNVISPGHSFVWKYGVPKGKYVVMCFWPSKTDGTPHAVMGMFKLFHLI